MSPPFLLPRRPPHPATIAQPKLAFGGVAPPRLPPHPATIAQPKPAFGGVAPARAPHPATAARPRGTPGAAPAAPVAQRSLVPAERTDKMADLTAEEKASVKEFARLLCTLTDQAYKEILAGDFTAWKKTPKVVEWFKKRGHWTESMRIGYAIEERVYQLCGWEEGPKTGTFTDSDGREYTWVGQGCSSLSSGTQPDFCLKLRKDTIKEALFDISSDLLYETTGKLHITSKSPPWTGSGGVAFAAEIQYPAFAPELLEALASSKKVDEKQVQELHRKLIEQKEQAYADALTRRQEIVDVIDRLWNSKLGRANSQSAFKNFRDWVFDGNIIGNATTEANNFLRINNIRNISGQPKTTASATADQKILLNERYDEWWGASDT